MKKAAHLLVVFVSVRCFAQAPVSPPAFDTASIRLSSPESVNVPGRRLQTTPNSLTTRGLTLRGCILEAYRMGLYQLIGPDWLNDVQLDIVAKTAEPVKDQQLYLMLRTLLSERMGVRAHVEQRKMPVYVLTLAKGGPKFSESTTEGPVVMARDKDARLIQRISIADLAGQFSKMLGRPVVDSTGLKGRYDVRLDMASVASVNQKDQMDAASAAIKLLQGLGLKVEDGKEMVDVLVVDHAEKTPTEN